MPSGRVVAGLLAFSVVAHACYGASSGDDRTGGGATGGGAGSTTPAGGDGSGVGGGGAGTTSPDSRPCSSDKECTPNGQLCNTARRLCVACIVAVDCGQDMACVRSECVALTPCTNSLDCNPGQVCGESSGYCVECETEADCEATQVCSNQTCVATCDSDKDCTGAGLLCDTAQGLCVECTAEADCGAAQYCDTGACAADACSAGATFCSTDGIITCTADGSGFLAPVPCAGTCTETADGAVCDGAGSGGAGAGSGGGGGAGGDGPLAGGAGGMSGPGQEPGPVSCATPGAATPGAIDDMEESSTMNFCNAFTPIGYWSVFGGLGIDRAAMPVARGTSLAGLHLTGTAVTGHAGGAFTPTLYDASAYQGFGFWAQGPEGLPLGIGLHTFETIEDNYQGFFLEPAASNTGLTLSGTWTYYRVYFVDLQATGAVTTINKAQLAEIELIISGTDVDVWIDDMSFFP